MRARATTAWLVAAMGLHAQQRVFDIGSGVGGPPRRVLGVQIEALVPA